MRKSPFVPRGVVATMERAGKTPSHGLFDDGVLPSIEQAPIRTSHRLDALPQPYHLFVGMTTR